MLAHLKQQLRPSGQHVKHEESPEQEEHESNNNEKITVSRKQDDNNNETDSTEEMEANGERVLSAEDIDICMADSPSQLASSLSTAWIYSFDKSAIWPCALQSCFPEQLHRKAETRKVEGRNSDEKMQAAIQGKDRVMRDRCEKLQQHNNYVAHFRLLQADKLNSRNRSQIGKVTENLEMAKERREKVLSAKKRTANVLGSIRVASSEENESSSSLLKTISFRRMESAVRFRSEILKEKSRRAGRAVQHARFVATKMTEAENDYSEWAEKNLSQRLQRAEIRRSIILDRRRLNAGRHINYAKSVYLTSQYMERRTGQMIQQNIDAATFRREVALEEIRSNARQHNLSAQFRACCAFRLFDAQWLNIALRSTAAQTQAEMRRDTILDQKLKRLHDAQVRRSEIKANYKFMLSGSTESTIQIQKRLDEASYRRDIFIMNRVEKIRLLRERNYTRKQNAKTSERIFLRKIIKDKVIQASKRREVFLERRRAKCAAINWHCKVIGHRQEEIYQELNDQRLLIINSKIEAARERKKEIIRPIFAELVMLRVARAKYIRESHQEEKSKYLARKNAFARIRIASICQARLNAVYNKLLHAKEVKQRMERFSSLKTQCISSGLFAKVRTAEIRRSLYIDAVKASAQETLQRAKKARERVKIRQNEKRYNLEWKMRHADARKKEILMERVAGAMWFLSKVNVAKKQRKEAAKWLDEVSLESLEHAKLRRSIRLTRTAQLNSRRTIYWSERMKMIKEGQKQKRLMQIMKETEATKRKNASVQRKVEVARSTSNRVVLARLEKRSVEVVDAAIRTAILNTMSKNAEARRQEVLESKQTYAAGQYSHAKAVAEAQKELSQVRAEAALEHSKLRVLQTTKRRENLMTQRKLGQSTIEHLQPYAGLQVIGRAIPICSHSA